MHKGKKHNADEDHHEFDHKPSQSDIEKASFINSKMKKMKKESQGRKAVKDLNKVVDDINESPLNHCESDMMHQGGWAKMRTINSPGTTGNKEGIAHNEKMRGFKLPHQSPLNKKGEKDACYHKVKSRVKVWPSAYASGQLVQCRKAGAANWGEKSKKK